MTAKTKPAETATEPVSDATDAPVTDAFETVAVPVHVAVQRPVKENMFTPVLTTMIRAFHDNDDKTPENGAVRYHGEGDAEALRKTANVIRDTARRMDASVSTRQVIDGQSITFWVVGARKYEKSDQA